MPTYSKTVDRQALRKRIQSLSTAEIKKRGLDLGKGTPRLKIAHSIIGNRRLTAAHPDWRKKAGAQKGLYAQLRKAKSAKNPNATQIAALSSRAQAFQAKRRKMLGRLNSRQVGSSSAGKRGKYVNTGRPTTTKSYRY